MLLPDQGNLICQGFRRIPVFSHSHIVTLLSPWTVSKDQHLLDNQLTLAAHEHGDYADQYNSYGAHLFAS